MQMIEMRLQYARNNDILYVVNVFPDCNGELTGI